jgi:hypothetical protein
MKKPRIINRKRFETCGWRSIELARGMIRWDDGTVNRFNVRLQAMPGTHGDVLLVAEDLNTESVKSMRLTCRP